jgi:uncharacterized membrane protein
MLPRWTQDVGWRTVVGALVLGGIIHIVATLAVPMRPGNAYQALRDTLPANRMVVLPLPESGKRPLPFMMPDALYAICRYEVANTPVIVTAILADAGWALSLHTPQGDNFYVMPAQRVRRNEVSLMLVPSGDRLADLVGAARRTAVRTTQIAAPTDEGLIVVRAPLRGLAWRAETESVLQHASCNPVKK